MRRIAVLLRIMPKKISHTQTAETLERLAEEFTRLSGELSAVASVIRQNEIDGLDVHYRAELKRALQAVANFAHDVKRATREAMWQGSQFSEEKPK